MYYIERVSIHRDRWPLPSRYLQLSWGKGRFLDFCKIGYKKVGKEADFHKYASLLKCQLTRKDNPVLEGLRYGANMVHVIHQH